MKLTIEFDDKAYPLDVPQSLLMEAADFFDKMDADMNCGWQMSRWWVPNPDELQRCQIAADKLLTAMHNDNREMALLMCAYILRAKPSTKRVRINTEGEIQGTEFLED